MPAALAQLPRVTLGVLLASLLLQLGTAIGFDARLREADRELRDAVALFVQDPMLAIPPRLAPVLSDRMPGYEGNAAFDFLKRRNDPARQAEFDALTARGLVQLDAHPQRVIGFVPARPSAVSWLLHPLAHAGLLHWLAAALPFAFAAGALERLWGWRFLAAVLPVASALSALAFRALDPDFDRPLLGLGSWSAALVAAFALRMRAARVDLFGWLRPIAELEWRAPAWSLAALFAVCELLAWLGSGSALAPSLRAHPALGTHLFCAALGSLCAFAIERSGAEARLGGVPPQQRSALAPPRTLRNSREAIAQGRAARAAGQLELAVEILAAEARRSPGHRELGIELWEVACQHSQPSRAFPAMQALIASELRRGAVDEAVSHWQRIAQVERRAVLEAETLLLLVPRIQQHCGEAELQLALEQLLRDPKLECNAELLLRVAELAAPQGGKLAREAVETLRELHDLAPAQQRLVAELARRAGLAAEGESAEATPVSASGAGAFYEEQDRSAFGSLAEATELTELTSLQEIETLPEARLFPAVTVRAGVPLELREDGIVLEIDARGRRKLPYARVRGVAFAGVRGLAPRAILVIDLLLSDPTPSAQPLEVVRLRSDGFNPLRLAPEAKGALEGLQSFVSELARRARVEVIPPAALGRVATYDSLAEYERRVLRVSSGDKPSST